VHRWLTDYRLDKQIKIAFFDLPCCHAPLISLCIVVTRGNFVVRRKSEAELAALVAEAASGCSGRRPDDLLWGRPRSG